MSLLPSTDAASAFGSELTQEVCLNIAPLTSSQNAAGTHRSASSTASGYELDSTDVGIAILGSRETIQDRNPASVTRPLQGPSTSSRLASASHGIVFYDEEEPSKPQTFKFGTSRQTSAGGIDFSAPPFSLEDPGDSPLKAHGSSSNSSDAPPTLMRTTNTLPGVRFSPASPRTRGTNAYDDVNYPSFLSGDGECATTDLGHKKSLGTTHLSYQIPIKSLWFLVQISVPFVPLYPLYPP